MEKYVNRDIDWVNFNARVLQEADDPTVPLFERLRFLAIFSSNLDEFFRVRISRLRQLKALNKASKQRLSFKPKAELKRILALVNRDQEKFGGILTNKILPALQQEGINILNRKDFDEDQRQFAVHFFRAKLKNQLKIISPDQFDIDQFEDGRLYFAVTLKKQKDKVYFIAFPEVTPRFAVLPSKPEIHAVTFVDEIILNGMDELMAPFGKVAKVYQIKLSRDSELYLEDELEEEFQVKMSHSLAKRRTGQPTRMLYDKAMPKSFLQKLQHIFVLGKVDLIAGATRHNFSDFFGFPFPSGKKHLNYDEHPPIETSVFPIGVDYFDTIAAKDRILHFPFHSFDHIDRWLAQAISDPNLRSIKISFYRLAKDSALCKLLIAACAKGIRVEIFMEIKARFDEANNLKWGEELTKAGADVRYSFPDVKVHSKIMLITRMEAGLEKPYAYIGTGNFNSKTAKIYTDHALLTADSRITSDLDTVFAYLKDPTTKPKLNTLLVAPFNLRKRMVELVDREIAHAKVGKPASIRAKFNSLEDRQMIDKLYEASEAGVVVDLVVRGMCCLQPGVAPFSSNIRVSSIVDRYLEHGRLFLFQNDGHEELFMGSADWMTRNLDHRVELIIPILDRDIFEELKQILEIQLGDNVKARLIDVFRSNSYKDKSEDSDLIIRSQYAVRDFLAKK